MIAQCMIEQGMTDKRVKSMDIPLIRRLFLHAPGDAKSFYKNRGFTAPPAEFNQWRRSPYSLWQMDIADRSAGLKLDWYLKFREWYNETYPFI